MYLNLAVDCMVSGSSGHTDFVFSQYSLFIQELDTALRRQIPVRILAEFISNFHFKRCNSNDLLGVATSQPINNINAIHHKLMCCTKLKGSSDISYHQNSQKTFLLQLLYADCALRTTTLCLHTCFSMRMWVGWDIQTALSARLLVPKWSKLLIQPLPLTKSNTKRTDRLTIKISFFQHYKEQDTLIKLINTFDQVLILKWQTHKDINRHSVQFT